MPTLRVNGYDLAFAERGEGTPLVMVHGTLCDYRHWAGQMAPFGAHYRTIALSLRHCWPEHWDGEGDDFTVQQHTADVAGFISALDSRASPRTRTFARRAHCISRGAVISPLPFARSP